MGDILQWLGGFLSLFWKVIVSYCTYGMPFAVAHGVVVAMLVYDTWYSKILLETKALEAWRPRRGPRPPEMDASGSALEAGPRSDKEAETTHILDQFVAECKRLGGQGFFVPMTDFSDRLDSIVDGITSELHDRTNLFILVGVAGSLLGIFEFAYLSNGVLQNAALQPGERLIKLGEFLSSSMAKAFPVGFMGLVFTFVAQVLTSRPERRLRTALTAATRWALEVRKEESSSQAQIVRDSVRAMQGAMRPLENLQEALTGSIEPVVKGLGERLEESLKLVKTQFDEMQRTNAGTREIVGAVNEAVASLRKIVDNLIEQGGQAQQLNANAIQIQQQQMVSLFEFRENVNASLDQVATINRSLIDAIDRIETMANGVHQAAQMKFDEVARDTLKAWRGMSDEIKDLVVVDHTNLLDGVASQVKEVEGSLLAASSELHAVAGGVRMTLDGLKAMPDSLLGEIKKNFSILSDASIQLWNSKTSDFVLDMQRQYLHYFSAVQDETGKVRQALQNASEALEGVSRSMDMIMKDSLRLAIREVKSELAGGIEGINRIVATYPKITDDILTLSNGLTVAVEKAGAIQQESMTWLEGVRGAHEHITEINNLLAEALRQSQMERSPSAAGQMNGLLEQNVTELRRISGLFEQAKNLIPPSDQVQNELREVIASLAVIRGDLERSRRVLETANQPHDDEPDGWWPPWPFRNRG